MSLYVAVLAALVLTLLSTNTHAEEKCTVGTMKGQYAFTDEVLSKHWSPVGGL